MFIVRVKNIQVGTVISHADFFGVSEHIPVKTIFSEEMHQLVGKEITVIPFPIGVSPWDTMWYTTDGGPFPAGWVFHSSWLDFEKSKTRYQILKENFYGT